MPCRCACIKKSSALITNPKDFLIPYSSLLFTIYTLGPASITSCGVPSVNLAKFWMKRIARSV